MKKYEFVEGLKVWLRENGYNNVRELLDEKNGMGVYENGCWFSNCSDCLIDGDIVEEVDKIISCYCDDNNVEIIV